MQLLRLSFKNKPRKFLFLITMWIGIVLFFLLGLTSHGAHVLSSLHNDINDTFMDFFNSIQYERHPYEAKVIYPPLANAFYYLIHALIPNDVFLQGTVAMRDSQIGRMIIILYTIVTMFLLYFAITKLDKKSSPNMQMLFFFTILFSAPMLFTLERANLIIVALIFMIFFCTYYKSDEKILRHFSFLSLAIAASIKIYPAILGLLLIRDKRWKDTIICIIYGILLFFTPFSLFGGLKGFTLMISNIVNCGSEMLANGEGWKLSILSICNYFSVWFTGTTGSYNALATLLKITCVLGGCLILLFVEFDEEWKLYMVPMLIMVLFPDFSFIYSGIFFIIPLLYYLNMDKPFKKIDTIYIILFLLIMLPLGEKNLDIFMPFRHDYYPLNLSTFIESLACLTFMLLIWADGFIHLFRSFISKLFYHKKDI